jgi:hypothetical protein
MEKHKLFSPDCIDPKGYYQQYSREGNAYCVINHGDICISYYASSFGIINSMYAENYLYAKISEHSFNRIKRIVMKKLGI